MAQRPKQHNRFFPHTMTPQSVGRGTGQGWGRHNDQAFFTLQLLEVCYITKYEQTPIEVAKYECATGFTEGSDSYELRGQL